MKKSILFILFILVLCKCVFAKQVLMFVAHEQTYYSEYIVMKKMLEAQGYSVDVRSASNLPTSFYMVPSSTDIVATANTMSGSSYNDFIFKFNDLSGIVWQNTWNLMPAFENVQGAIQDVNNMNGYDALVIVGGLGALDYRVDGTYFSQGTGVRTLSSATIQAAALKLNNLAIEALANGKPVLAQCHAASLAAFWRIPNTVGIGAETLGFSLLKNQIAAGFPDQQTATDYGALQVTLRPDDRVCISSPHESFIHQGSGTSKIITSRDWYPQTVLYAAQTLLNILNTYPSKALLESQVKVLVLHGGTVDINNCSANNRNNDIPCNYGTGVNLPADYTDIVGLLNANSSNDDFQFTTTHLNLTGSLPFNNNNATEISNYLQQFHTVIFFKHWSTGVTNALQTALVQFADAGGGVIGLHHALYNDIDGSWNKNILVNQLFGAQSSMNNWSANRTSILLLHTNFGHFISSYGVNYGSALSTPPAWIGTNFLSGTNASYSTYSRISVFDELYNNMSFVNGQTFGNAINQITPLFSNNQMPSEQVHTSGFVKLFNPTGDATIGKVAYFIAGESKQSFSLLFGSYGQVIRNAVVWAAKREPITLPISLEKFHAFCNNGKYFFYWLTNSEINNHFFEIQMSSDGISFKKIATILANGFQDKQQEYHFSTLKFTTQKVYFRLKQVDKDGTYSYSSIQHVACNLPASSITIIPNPATNFLRINFNDLAVTNERIHIKILNTDGKILQSTKYTPFNQSIIIDVSNLSKGAYLLSIHNSTMNKTETFIKQ